MWSTLSCQFIWWKPGLRGTPCPLPPDPLSSMAAYNKIKRHEHVWDIQPIILGVFACLESLNWFPDKPKSSTCACVGQNLCVSCDFMRSSLKHAPMMHQTTRTFTQAKFWLMQSTAVGMCKSIMSIKLKDRNGVRTAQTPLNLGLNTKATKINIVTSTCK